MFVDVPVRRNRNTVERQRVCRIRGFVLCAQFPVALRGLDWSRMQHLRECEGVGPCVSSA